ncbi:MAG: HDIG domain-containing protein [Candidatus Omnitrophica bacterium]|nr:HDIG domain-containing protein [Candidatus Omnitrophota bacterium]
MKKIRFKSRIKVSSIFKAKQALAFLNVRKNTAAGVYLFIAALIIIAIASVADVPTKGELHEGDVAAEDIYAPFDFTYLWGINKEKTGAQQKAAASLVDDIYTMDLNVLNEAKNRVNTFFDSLNKNADAYNIKVSGESLKELASFQDKEKLRQVCLSALDAVLSEPTTSESYKDKLSADKAKKITVKTTEDKTERSISPSDILSLVKAKDRLDEYIEKNLDTARAVKKAVAEILAAQPAANLVYDEQKTALMRKEAENSVKPVYIQYDVKKGEIIIFKGERVSSLALAKLAEIKELTQKNEDVRFFFNFGLILMLLFFILVIYTRLFEPEMLRDNKAVLLICLLLILITAISKIIVMSPLSGYLIPVASVTMLFTLLVGNTAVFPLLIIMSFIVSVMMGLQFNMFLVTLMSSIIGVFVVKETRRRSHLLKAGLYLGVANFICVASLALLENLDINVMLTEGAWGIGGGFFSAALTMLCLPAFERIFHLTTNIGLLELADLNHPLLREMANKAPGTYHHSLIVGNLAEVACESIGANSLLARVGAYYHDIGKIGKAEYFSENEPITTTSHDDLTPYMSSLIITNHVKDGVDLAKKYNLPQPIIDMIEQHHGSGLIYYFYQKALEKGREEEAVKEEGFRYPGPKPQTKEAAVVLLADSVEAASRTLADPTPARLEELVRRIINNKFIDRQLDECQLTLHDIDTISKNFIRILIGIYHVRVEYPTNGKHK